jgi:hypothetical protein
MGNRFKIRRGSVSPVNAADIENYELVYNYTDNELWTKHGGSVVKISSGTNGTVTNVVAGAGLTGGGTSTATLDVVGGTGISVSANAIAVSGLTVSELAANSLQLSSESFAYNNTSLMTSAAIADKIEAYGYTTSSGLVSTTGTISNGDYGRFNSSGVMVGLSKTEVQVDLDIGDLAALDTLGTGHIPNLPTSKITSGTFVTSRIPDLAASKITSGTFAAARIPDSFLKNDANDTTSGTITAGGFTTAGSITIGGHSFNDIDIGSEFNDVDDHLMSSGAIKEKIEGYGYATSTGDITGITTTANSGLTGGATSGTASLIVDHLRATDDRDVKPSAITTGGKAQVRAYFTSLGGLTGTANSDYQDLLVLSTYSDDSGGDVNALAFDKSTQNIYHYLADQGASTWGTAKRLAYIENGSNNRVMTASSSSTVNGEGNLTFDGTDLFVAHSSGAIKFAAAHATDKIQLYNGGNEKIGTSANTIIFTGDNHKFIDTSSSETMQWTSSNNYLTIHETGASKGSHLRLATDNSDYIITAGGGSNQLSVYDVTSASNRLVINSGGAISTGVWNGTAIASAYLDADTAHLSTNQTFSGVKTF